ncbi:serine racemase VanT catalytic subunit [Clostridium sp. 'deep sea']|uniref:serine racemase VanT catalytic subunit n=1 Tax=Clostridium sp. 'deep sea' TaxID=2779445 RepID=UPI001A9B2264|nr:serine racemase VanT catalytic subunit [Clostridium sp. 'deep sea']
MIVCFALIQQFFLYQLILTVHITIPKILRRMSLIIYLIHPLVIVLIRAFAKIINNEYLVDNNLVFFVLVTILSIFISYIFCKITEDKQPQNLKSRAWAEINLKNLQHNYQEIKNILPNSCEFMAVVKANAYGHGSIKVAKTLQKLGCNSYAVASINEAIELRKARIKGDILILGYTSINDLYKLNKYNLIQTAVDYNYAKQLNSFNNNIRTHLKLDTGMHRLGEDYKHIKTIENMLKLPNIIVEGIYTHLCVADSLSVYNIKYSEFQIENFYQVLQKLKSLGLKIPKHHIQSSYGVVNYPELKCDYARVGIFLYGSKSQVKDEVKIELNLKPLLSVKARISAIKKIPAHQPIGYGRKHIPIKDSTIATLTIGYADGIPRNLNNAYVLVKDQKAPIIGLICMDQMTVDISNINNVNQGDIVTILGVDINKEISALQLATSANIITNELYSRLGERLNRIYV